ncbi:MAG: AMP-binding protein [Burkholderiales bacterium]|nr:AMP-binding protein [Burkholderiales bacterium]
MTPRRWLRHYPAGVPAEIDVTRYPSLVALFDESFALYRDRTAYVLAGRSMSFGDIDAMSRALAAWLQAQGIARGDRVAIMLPNLLHYPVAVAAVLRAGAIVVNVDPLDTARELEHRLQDSGAKAIVVLEAFAGTLAQLRERTDLRHVVVASPADALAAPQAPAAPDAGRTRFGEALAAGAGLPLRAVPVGPEHIAVLQYTGGITGVSKGAALPHRAIVASLLSSEAWLQPGLKRRPISGQMTIVCALPLCHVFAFVGCGLLGLRTGALNILIPNPRDLGALIRQLEPYKLHVFPAVNTLFDGLVQHPDFARLDFSELCVSNGGGMAVQEAVARKWLQVTGCPIVEGYGLSETASGVTCNSCDSETFTGTIGLPMPGVDIRLLDDEGYDAAPGEPGEIAIRAPQLMAGYWQRADETAKVMVGEGYFKSGDIGVMDGRGCLKIVDRKKDMILVCGCNVYPTEIEGVVAGHPKVLECAAFGVPDAGSGEAVKLAVVRRDDSLDEAELRAFCQARLTGCKRPRFIEFRAELPKSNVGKILRRELRDAGRAGAA